MPKNSNFEKKGRTAVIMNLHLKKINMKYLFLLLSMSLYSQVNFNKFTEEKLQYADSILKAAVGDEIFKVHFLLDTAKSSNIYFKDINEIESTDLPINKDFTNGRPSMIVLVYNIHNSGLIIGHTSFQFHLNSNRATQYSIKGEAEFLKPYVDLFKGKYINLEKAILIAKMHGFNNIGTHVLEDDPRWKGPNYYNSENSKVVWMIKERLSNGHDLVIRINAKNGKVIRISEEWY